MKTNMDKLLKAALAPMDEPDEELNAQILRKVKERQRMVGKNRSCKRKIPAAALVAACILTLCSGTALAVYKYLSPAEVATELNDGTLEKAFLGEDAILVNETQESGGYRITLLGSVAGKNISDFLCRDADEASGTESDKIYTVVAIERADGSPMPDTSSDGYGEEAFFASHYIRGFDPGIYNIMGMGGGYSTFVRDGIMYRLLEMDNIEMFADRGIYVGVSSGTFYDAEAYRFDANTGEVSRNDSYGGVNALFHLPVDASKADPAAAEAFLREFEASMNGEEGNEPVEKDANGMAIEEFMSQLTPENIDEYARPIEYTRQTCKIEKPDGDGNSYVSYSYELEDGSAAGSGTELLEALFPDGRPGMSPVFGYSSSEDGLSGLMIDVFILNEDGTVTYVMYQPK